MKQYFSLDPWRIVEEGFHADEQRVSESAFSLGNGRMGQRGHFEEHYSGDSMQGNYFAGIYYPDKTRVGWWKNGYPEYFAKVLNAVHWCGLDIAINQQRLDLAETAPVSFRRELDMRTGILSRTFSIQTDTGTLHFAFERFCSLDAPDTGAVRLVLKSEDFSGEISVSGFLNSDVRNQDANWDESFWEQNDARSSDTSIGVEATTRKTGFTICSVAAMQFSGVDAKENTGHNTGFASWTGVFTLQPGDIATIDKIVVHHSSLYYDRNTLWDTAHAALEKENTAGYNTLRAGHVAAWETKWQSCDIEIDGDVSAQQAIRFCIFQLLQTYTGDDPRLNIGPKGFTGEKYGGSTYWDTEAYCLPFYLGTCPPAVGHQLLVYRYRHLQKAIENAAKLGFSKGAALYPMVTMNGEECHNEWEITFEEIHRNGAIAYAIYDFIRYTGDDRYLMEGGIEVLSGIARFWAQRVHFSQPRQKYVMLGVTGPNEYENNVDNNWYTNYIARWCLRYTAECIALCKAKDARATDTILHTIDLSGEEIQNWLSIADQMYFPENTELGIFLQQDNYLEKEQLTVADLKPEQRPLNQKWSWDRILRSCFIKQADVLQGMYFFEEDFDRDALRRNFLFYEPRTVHESSLSPCIHSILASALDMPEKAYEMYLRTGRLDLDNYNNDTEDGLHITSMAGTWLALVKGFAGLRVRDNMLALEPRLPAQWKGLTFHLYFRKNIVRFRLTKEETLVTNISGDTLSVIIEDTQVDVAPNSQHAIPTAQNR